MILLDTDTVSLFHEGHPQVVERIKREGAAENIATTIVTEAEILRARYEFLIKAKDGETWQRAQQWLNSSLSLLDDFEIIEVNAASAEQFDALRVQKKIKKIGRADLLIASIALARNAILITRNVRHFRNIPGLTIDNWAD